MANQPIIPNPVPPMMKPPLGAKPVAPPSVPMAPGKMGPGGPQMAGKMAPLPPGVKPPPGQGQPGEPGDEEEEEGRSGSFWEQPWVQNILPFMTSLSVHAGLVVIALVLAKTAWKPPADENKEAPVTAEAGVVKIEGGVKFQGPRAQDSNRQFAQDTDPSSTTNGFADNKVSHDTGAAGGGAGDSTASNIQVGFGSLGGGKGLGSGKGSGRGTGDGGEQAPFGVPGGGGIGPQGPVFGNGGKARKIAFVCDASGSMINKMPTLKEQLQKTFMGLRPIQAFDMIFFQDQKFDSFSKYAHSSGLVNATPENKRNAQKFLEGVTTTGSTDPIPGIEAAFKMRPQLIYILTDGDFPDNDAVLKKITDLNKSEPKVKINTIAFVGDGDNETAFLELLKKVAAQNGGTFVHVKESDLDR